MNQTDSCPICGGCKVTQFLSREQVPVHQNLVMKNQKSATKITRGSLELTLCQECGFIFNRAFEPSKLSYGEDYDNTQTCSPSFSEYITRLAYHLIFKEGIQNCHIVEVGCGKGVFLRKLVEIEHAGNSGYGFDPSYIGQKIDLNGRLKFKKRYFGPDCTDIPADVVVCRHVVEHIPKPLDLLHAIKQALVKSPHARLFIETPCVEWILHNQIVWDFFYEHCSYFTAGSLTTALESAGFSVKNVRHVFQGQYLWLEARIPIKAPVVTKNPCSIQHLAELFTISESKLKKKLKIKIQELASKGIIALWGAGAKGATFANLIDPKRKFFECIVDLNPKKQGRYIPGTGHLIVGYRDLAKRAITSAVLMNPNYRDESQSLLRQAHINTKLVEME